jgi:tetratricopeptide (TPR) repeat protein
MNNTDFYKVVDELGSLLDRSALQIMRTPDPALFLHWFRDSAAEIAPAFVGQLSDDERTRRSYLYTMSRMIWDNTPLPDNRFCPRPLHKPERSLPCPCGSGRKYKECCASAESKEGEIENFGMLLHVLNQLPVKKFAQLPFENLDPNELAYVARMWTNKGKTKGAIKLLEGLFAQIEILDRKVEYAFDLLLDCYDNQGNPVKKNRLLDRGLAASDKYIRATAMQRICRTHSDKGDYARAWSVFQDIQRLIPNDASLAHLEVVLLHGQGEHERATERGKFWIARLSRDDPDGHADLIEFLERAATEPGGIDPVRNGIAELGVLSERVKGMPEPLCLYLLDSVDGGARALRPDAALLQLTVEWRGIFKPFTEGLDGIDWRNSQHWLAWLGDNPLAWHSFDVLGDLAQALEDGMPPFPDLVEHILLPLMQRGSALLQLIFRQHRAEGMRLAWSQLENRHALHLVDALSDYYESHNKRNEAVHLMEWLVLTLNPEDNQGKRGKLLHHYLRLGKPDAAISLAEHYPRDMASVQYGHALALLMSGRQNDAETVLTQARADYPEICKMLVHPGPRRPSLKKGIVAVGGRDEAWHYRKDYLDLWQQCGGLAWLCGQKPVEPAA